MILSRSVTTLGATSCLVFLYLLSASVITNTRASATPLSLPPPSVSASSIDQSWLINDIPLSSLEQLASVISGSVIKVRPASNCSFAISPPGPTGFAPVAPNAPNAPNAPTPPPMCDGPSPVFLVVACNSLQDVQQIVLFAHKYKVQLTVHASLASPPRWDSMMTRDTIVVDITQMKTVVLDAEQRLARVAGGATLGDLANTILPADLTIPLEAPEITVGGYLQGGGHAIGMPFYGLACDAMEEAEVVIADGTVVTANRNTNSDLFWALRGGGGSNFGVVTTFTLRLTPTTLNTYGLLMWPVVQARAVLRTYFTFLQNSIDRKFSFYAGVGYHTVGNTNQLVVFMVGTYFDNMSQAQAALYGFTSIPGAMVSLTQGSYKDALAFITSTDLHAPLPSSHLRSTLPAFHHFQSRFVDQQFSDEAIDKLVQVMQSVPPQYLTNNYIYNVSINLDNTGVVAYFEPMGGKVRDPGVDNSAYAFRNMLSNFVLKCKQQTADYEPNNNINNNNENNSVQTWLNDAMNTLQPYLTKHTYVNYPNLQLDPQSYPSAYYGDHYGQLQHIKTKYDPMDLFQALQSVTPARDHDLGDLGSEKTSLIMAAVAGGLAVVFLLVYLGRDMMKHKRRVDGQEPMYQTL